VTGKGKIIGKGQITLYPKGWELFNLVNNVPHFCITSPFEHMAIFQVELKTSKLNI
jgi:hypothetical protein